MAFLSWNYTNIEWCPSLVSLLSLVLNASTFQPDKTWKIIMAGFQDVQTFCLTIMFQSKKKNHLTNRLPLNLKQIINRFLYQKRVDIVEISEIYRMKKKTMKLEKLYFMWPLNDSGSVSKKKWRLHARKEDQELHILTLVLGCQDEATLGLHLPVHTQSSTQFGVTKGAHDDSQLTTAWKRSVK